MTIPQVHSLADRLEARGGTLPPEIPAQPGDFALAAKALRALTRAFHRSDVLMLDCT